MSDEDGWRGDGEKEKTLCVVRWLMWGGERLSQQ